MSKAACFPIESTVHPLAIIIIPVGNNLTLDNSRPADVLVGNWDRGKPATFDFTVSSPLSSAILSEASANTGAAARSASTELMM